MDFVNRSQQVRSGGPSGVHVTGGSESSSGKRSGKSSESKWYRLGSVVLLILISVLVIALIIMFTWGANNQQSKLVNKDQYQAVFINVNGTTGGQVYFGHIKDITGSYIDLTNVFYIQNQSGQSSNNSYTLVKLGCELHGPSDQMVINNSQVYFWENLKPSGQVAQKIADFYKQNPNGQNCSQSSASNSTNQSSANTQSTSNTSTTPNPTPATNKP
ncbi:MAG TPA: hypothetical protein VLG47_01280 [Candidatus Saccharimonadales bacterium]|nr:hypothetical protein [Candidatus Saccharimonadales bacterium]